MNDFEFYSLGREGAQIHDERTRAVNAKIYATTGKINADGSATVVDSGAASHVWVKINDNQAETKSVLNKKTGVDRFAGGVGVWLAWSDAERIYEVDGLAGPSNQATLPMELLASAETPTLAGDTDTSIQPNALIKNLRVRTYLNPSTLGYGLIVYIEAGYYYVGSTQKYWPGGTLDLASVVPAVSGTKTPIVIGFDSSGNALAYAGTAVAQSILPVGSPYFSGDQWVVARNAASTLAAALFGIGLLYGQTTITNQADFVDLRVEQVNGGGSGTGTVTSVGVSTNASYLTVGSSPVTTSGTITVNKTTGLTANQFVGTPNGSTGTADLRALVADDYPTMVGDSGSGGTKGAVPAPASGDAAAGKFLKADGTFAVPSGTGAAADGWASLGYSLAYASADSPTFTMTASGVDLTGILSVGMKMKLTQTTVKYFIITAISFSTNTTITIYGGTSYTLANAAIGSPYYSTAKAPQAFPLDPTGWTVRVTDTTTRTQTSPVDNTWYNIGTTNSQIVIPIGCWRVSYQVNIYGIKTNSGEYLQTTLSTANNSSSDNELLAYGAVGQSTLVEFTIPATRSKKLTLASKTTYFLNGRSLAGSLTSISFLGGNATTVIEAECAYL